MIRKIIISVLLSCCIVPAGAAGFFISNVHVAVQKNRRIVLTVRLSVPSELKVYYDTQKPSNTAKLFQFWFNSLSTGKKKIHHIVLREASGSGILYFRFEKKTGAVAVSRLYCWKKNHPITVE